ncbi:hypothetical protein [Streptomyces candidus]|uniref:Uncharacterized protein n=1 Tax=Streptomyces candidus TaxID=67283 RepID=A0A7X0HME4_9ACTN|nr:hypothetical protein [Streptomyces candidus]MBB6439054.1 hypothetical protein [Streptomyces candidus]GHH55470.1 hypothetical protein GCM10018773_59940 [Streptomyces candidus]
MSTDSQAADPGQNSVEGVEALLVAAHRQLGIAVADRINAQGGPPELRPPDLALDRLLAATHRAVGGAVGDRLFRETHAGLAGRASATEGRSAAEELLWSRSPAIRVKYRAQALRLAHTYWPFDLVHALRDCITALQELSGLLAGNARLARTPERAVDTVRSHLDRLARLPEPARAPGALAGLNYLDTIEALLSHHTGRILTGLQELRDLLEEELAPTVHSLGGLEHDSLFGVGAVAQDMIDDLTHDCSEANALEAVVAEVERASNDFLGADLSSAKLDGVGLEGILWDVTTIWPENWEARVRKASRPSDEEQGVLVVAAEGCSTVIHAEA